MPGRAAVCWFFKRTVSVTVCDKPRGFFLAVMILEGIVTTTNQDGLVHIRRWARSWTKESRG